MQPPRAHRRGELSRQRPLAPAAPTAFAARPSIPVAARTNAPMRSRDAYPESKTPERYTTPLLPGHPGARSRSRVGDAPAARTASVRQGHGSPRSRDGARTLDDWNTRARLLEENGSVACDYSIGAGLGRLRPSSPPTSTRSSLALRRVPERAWRRERYLPCTSLRPPGEPRAAGLGPVYEEAT